MSKATKADTPQKVNYNDAVAESKKYFDGDDLAATVWVSKYALKDSFGNIYEKSPREMHERIASEIERIEQKYPNPLPKEEVFALLDHFRYVIPQGGPMTGIGNNFQVASLSNCFVIGHKNPGRLLRRHLPHGRGAGAADETPRRRGARPLAHPSHGQPGAQLGAHVDGYRALHGALFRTRRARWRRTAAAVR